MDIVELVYTPMAYLGHWPRWAEWVLIVALVVLIVLGVLGVVVVVWMAVGVIGVICEELAKAYRTRKSRKLHQSLAKYERGFDEVHRAAYAQRHRVVTDYLRDVKEILGEN